MYLLHPFNSHRKVVCILGVAALIRVPDGVHSSRRRGSYAPRKCQCRQHGQYSPLHRCLQRADHSIVSEPWHLHAQRGGSEYNSSTRGCASSKSRVPMGRLADTCVRDNERNTTAHATAHEVKRARSRVKGWRIEEVHWHVGGGGGLAVPRRKRLRPRSDTGFWSCSERWEGRARSAAK
jgi:hypothetical protein